MASSWFLMVIMYQIVINKVLSVSEWSIYVRSESGTVVESERCVHQSYTRWHHLYCQVHHQMIYTTYDFNNSFSQSLHSSWRYKLFLCIGTNRTFWHDRHDYIFGSSTSTDLISLLNLLFFLFLLGRHLPRKPKAPSFWNQILIWK